MTSTTSLVIISVFIVVGLITYGEFTRWKREVISELNNNSEIVQTVKGQVEYKFYGEGGEVVLFLHGTPGSYDQFIPDGNPLFESRRVLSMSRPGYLRTDSRPGESLKDQADMVAALLDTLDIETVLVMGASGGAPLALAFSAYYPSSARLLVLYTPVSQSREQQRLGIVVSLLQKVISYDFTAWIFFRYLLNHPDKLVKTLIRDPATQRKILADQKELVFFTKSLGSVLPPSLRNSGHENDLRLFKNLDLPKNKITAPVLILHGTEDVNVPIEQSELLNKQVPGSILVRLKGGDHFALYSHRQVIYDAIDEFLSVYAF